LLLFSCFLYASLFSNPITLIPFHSPFRFEITWTLRPCYFFNYTFLSSPFAS
jgi:hypothetical protein